MKKGEDIAYWEVAYTESHTATQTTPFSRNVFVLQSYELVLMLWRQPVLGNDIVLSPRLPEAFLNHNSPPSLSLSCPTKLFILPERRATTGNAPSLCGEKKASCREIGIAVHQVAPVAFNLVYHSPTASIPPPHFSDIMFCSRNRQSIIWFGRSMCFITRAYDFVLQTREIAWVNAWSMRECATTKSRRYHCITSVEVMFSRLIRRLFYKGIVRK